MHTAMCLSEMLCLLWPQTCQEAMRSVAVNTELHEGFEKSPVSHSFSHKRKASSNVIHSKYFISGVSFTDA